MSNGSLKLKKSIFETYDQKQTPLLTDNWVKRLTTTNQTETLSLFGKRKRDNVTPAFENKRMLVITNYRNSRVTSPPMNQDLLPHLVQSEFDS